MGPLHPEQLGCSHSFWGPGGARPLLAPNAVPHRSPADRVTREDPGAGRGAGGRHCPGRRAQGSQCRSLSHTHTPLRHTRMPHARLPLLRSEAGWLSVLTHTVKVNPSLLLLGGAGRGAGRATPRRARTAPSPRCPCRAGALAAGSATGRLPPGGRAARSPARCRGSPRR